MVATETSLTRDEVIKILTENEVSNVTFYKVNGELRDMVCTLNQDQLALIAQDPEHADAVVSGDGDLEYDENQIRVYDVEKKGWRSFLLTNLITIEGSNT